MFFRRKSVKLLLASVTLAVSVLSAGCASGKEEGSDNAGNQGASASSEGGAYTVQHAMGTTTIPATPKRVVVLTNEGTEAVLAMGVKPVGAVKAFQGDPWYNHTKDLLKDTKNLGLEESPSIEDIIALKPDLIIGNKMRQEKIYDQLSAIAPTVFSETLRGQWKDNFKLYALALNKKEEGDKILAAFDQRVQDFRQKAGDKLKTQVSIVRFMPDRVRIYYKDTFSGVILNQIGLARPKAQDKDEFAADVSKESIPQMDGDILFYFTYDLGDGKGKKMEDEWVNDPLWQNLNAVKNHKAYKVDDVIWNTAGGVLAANLMLDDLYKFFDIK